MVGKSADILNSMKATQTILLSLLMSSIIGCDTGGCYYTCCTSDEDCTASCGVNYESAEECTVAAQNKCAEKEGYIIRVEWSEMSEVFCDSCGASACAPNWWTADNDAQEVSNSTDQVISSTDDKDPSDTSSESNSTPNVNSFHAKAEDAEEDAPTNSNNTDAAQLNE